MCIYLGCFAPNVSFFMTPWESPPEVSTAIPFPLHDPWDIFRRVGKSWCDMAGAGENCLQTGI